MIHWAFIIFDTVWLVAMVPVFVWIMVCTRRAGEERIAVYTSIAYRPVTGPMILLAIQAISFKQHLRARIFRRDPWALYDPMVLDAIKNPRTEVFGGAVMPGGHEEGPPAIH